MFQQKCMIYASVSNIRRSFPRAPFLATNSTASGFSLVLPPCFVGYLKIYFQKWTHMVNANGALYLLWKVYTALDNIVYHDVMFLAKILLHFRLQKSWNINKTKECNGE